MHFLYPDVFYSLPPNDLNVRWAPTLHKLNPGLMECTSGSVVSASSVDWFRHQLKTFLRSSDPSAGSLLAEIAVVLITEKKIGYMHRP